MVTSPVAPSWIESAREELRRAVATIAEVCGHEQEPQPGVRRLVEW